MTDQDYEHFVPAFERLVKQHAKIRVLFEMADFHGWEMAALWDDIKFDLKRFADIERLAMVGDKRSERGMGAGIWCTRRAATNLNERYVREWLGAMVTAGVVDVDATST